MSAVENSKSTSFWRREPWRIGAASTLLLSILCSLPVAIPALTHLGAPWGAGDMTYFYFMGSTWGVVQHLPTTDVAFPFGMDPNAFAGLDGLIYFLASPITAITGNPYIGLNLLLLLSFPVVALLAYASIRLVGLEGPLAVVLANAFTFIPFHFGRGIGHLPLGMMFGLCTGVLLALLIGSGRLSRWSMVSTGREKLFSWVILFVLVIVTAWTGLYFAFFGVILVIAALIWRFAMGDDWRKLKTGLASALGLMGAISVGLATVLVSQSNSPSATEAALRDPMDSVTYAGNFAISLIPQPYSILSENYNRFVFDMFGAAPANEAHLMANFGTWVTSIAVVVFLVGLVTYNRAKSRATVQNLVLEEVKGGPVYASISYISYLLLIVISLFIPWGLNFLFSYLATAQIRAWNRLLPYILMLIILGASSALASWNWPKLRIPALITSGAIVVITIVDMVLPWRNLYTYVPADGQVRVDAAFDYAAQVNKAIPEDCGVLTLPFISYPGSGPAVSMDDYDHFTIALTNPSKAISYGAYRDSPSSQTLETLSSIPIASARWELAALGYCAIHVDARGYEDAGPINAELTAALGSPIAQVGSWTMYSLK